MPFPLKLAELTPMPGAWYRSHNHVNGAGNRNI